MKYSFMSFSCPELSLDEMIELAQKYGYDGIEPRISANHKHGIELDTSAAVREESKAKVEKSGIALCCVATSCTYADPEKKGDMVAATMKAIDLAGDIGCHRIRVFGGGIPEGVTREKAIDILVESMKDVSDHAGERNVIVCMETHDDWCDPAHLAEVMKRVDHPAIGINWDIMHPVRVAKVSIDEAFNTIKPWIRHIHFHDGLTNDDGLFLVPIGEGEIDHKRAKECLRSIDYDGFLSGEWISWEPYEKHLPRELATMKGYDG